MKIDIKHVIGYGILLIGYVVTLALWRYETGILKAEIANQKEFNTQVLNMFNELSKTSETNTIILKRLDERMYDIHP